MLKTTVKIFIIKMANFPNHDHLKKLKPLFLGQNVSVLKSSALSLRFGLKLVNGSSLVKPSVEF